MPNYHANEPHINYSFKTSSLELRDDELRIVISSLTLACDLYADELEKTTDERKRENIIRALALTQGLGYKLKDIANDLATDTNKESENSLNV